MKNTHSLGTISWIVLTSYSHLRILFILREITLDFVLMYFQSLSRTLSSHSKCPDKEYLLPQNKETNKSNLIITYKSKNFRCFTFLTSFTSIVREWITVIKLWVDNMKALTGRSSNKDTRNLRLEIEVASRHAVPMIGRVSFVTALNTWSTALLTSCSE